MVRLVTPKTTHEVGDALVRHRIANLGLVLASIGMAFVVMRVGSVLAVGKPQYLISTSMVVHYLAVFSSLIMWIACRVGTFRIRASYTVELAGLFVACSLYTVMAAKIPQAFRPEMTILLAFGVFLLAHAVHVPSSWKWTSALGAALAIPLFTGAWLILTPMDPRIVAASASAVKSVQTTPETIIGIGMASVITWWIVIVSTASAASAVIYGLRQEVHQAQQLGQYHVEAKLGEGGMGAVYRARHAMLHRKAAIKLIKPEVLMLDENRYSKLRKRFEREAHVTANLKSPHTVQLYDFGLSDEGSFYCVMELLDGIDLESMITQFGPMPSARAIYLLSQACDSLQEAHAVGLVHRDIKPANIFLCRHGIRYDFVKVLDFGLVSLGARPDQQDLKITIDGFIGGTPAFMPPELAVGKQQVDGRTDLYALGCVAYWLLTGQTPFERNTAMATVVAHINEEPPRPSQVSQTSIPQAFEDLIMRCLEKKVQDRPASAQELSRSLALIIPDDSWTQEHAKTWWDNHPIQPSTESITHTDEARITKALV